MLRKRKAANQDPNTTNGKYLLPWKRIFADRQRIESNWRHGRFVRKQLVGHTGRINSVLLEQNTLFTASSDKSIRIWDLQNEKNTQVLIGHTDSVTCIQLDSTKLFSGSTDKTIRIWSKTSGTCLRILDHSRHSVSALYFLDKLLVSGCAIDGQVSVWNISNGLFSAYQGQCFQLAGHRGRITGLEVTGNDAILTSSTDSTLLTWSITTRKQVAQINHNRDISCFKLNPIDSNQVIISGNGGESVDVYDLHTGNCVDSFRIAADLFSVDKMRMAVLKSSTIKVVEWGNWAVVLAEFSDSAYSCLQLGEDCVATGSENGNVDVYCFF